MPQPWYSHLTFNYTSWYESKWRKTNQTNNKMEDTATLFIKSWVCNILWSTKPPCSVRDPSQSKKIILFEPLCKRCLFLDLFKSFPRNERIERTQKFVKMMTFLVYIVQRRSSPKAFFTGWSGVFSLWFYTLCINWYYPNLPIDCAHLFVYFCGVKSCQC